MNDKPGICVFDADGVVLDERIFWDTAIETALTHGRVADIDPDGLSAIGMELGLQRVAKVRGCNSNVDLAAVLICALEDDTLRYLLETATAASTAMSRWIAVAESSYHSAAAAYDDPLNGFGIDRTGQWYRGVSQLFAAALARRGAASEDGLCRFREPLGQINAALARLKAMGFKCMVCTGRSTEEVGPALNQLVAADNNPSVRDDVTWAEHRSGARMLGKPHWFPLVSAVVGRQAALEWVAGGGVADDRRVIYVGDAVADFKMARSARDLDWDVRFVHVRSGVTAGWQDDEIAGDDMTLASLERFSDVPDALEKEIVS